MRRRRLVSQEPGKDSEREVCQSSIEIDAADEGLAIETAKGNFG